MPKFIENTESSVLCPQCTPPRKLTVKTNRATGHQFLGCPNYPECTYTRGIPEEWLMRAAGQAGLFDTPARERRRDDKTQSENSDFV